MCFFIQQKAPIKMVEERFNARVENPDAFLQSDYINGFAHLNSPIIIDNTPEIISTNFSWGLLPSWSKDLDFRKNTLNARIETVDEKASFKNITSNRCLIIATGFFEWRWMDDKGKTKIKYEIHNQEQEIFCFAGLYNKGVNPQTGDVLNSFTMITTHANPTMEYIHNHKKRMPVMLNKKDEMNWLNPLNKIEEFAYPKYKPNLIGLEA